MGSDYCFLWDDAAIGDKSTIWNLDDGRMARIDALGDGVFRVRFSEEGRWTESGLNRYGFINSAFPEFAYSSEEQGSCLAVHAGSATLVMDRGGLFSLKDDTGALIAESSGRPVSGHGFRLPLRLVSGERIYGMGDSSRENVMRRGAKYNIWVVDVYGYIPVPLALSDRGWGIFINSTWRSSADIGCDSPDEAVFQAAVSPLDFYLFSGSGLPALIDKFTRITGRPKLLPVWGYALTYVAHEKINAFELMNEASEFRRQGIPCDAMGLEPGWMSEYYDKSLEKKWHPERFPMPWWAMSGPQTFPSALGRIGFKLSLWLCCDYDVTGYEEKRLLGETSKESGNDVHAGRAGAFEQDVNINPELAELRDSGKNKENADDEPWFEHLKKFVDQGVAAFKLDGAWQVVEHPDRVYANGMDDEQAHNLYPLIYDRQMSQGFEEHAGRRSMIYSASGFAGIQKYVASWAGDTGGGPEPLVSMLNLGICGHSNHSCDMDVFSNAGIHFGFLQTWAQLNNWFYWRQPWYLEPERLAMFRDYARLRYRILPYLYSAAWQASVSGMPVMRAMPLAFPDMEDCDSIMTEYMLGDSFLVTAFSDTLRLPCGEWLDFWTGRRYAGLWSGPAEFPADRGGCLLLKEGAIVPTWPVRPFVSAGYSDELGFIVNPGKSESGFVLYEDDGYSLENEKGAFTTTQLLLRNGKFSIRPREGGFEGMPARRKVAMEIHLREKPANVAVNGRNMEFSWNGRAALFSFELDSASGVDVSWG